MERNVISKKTKIVGEIKSVGDFRIDGTLEGNLKTKGKVIIGNSGHVKGNINAFNADVEGEITGKLEVQKTLTIKSTATISGEVIVGKLSIEPGAAFNATCVMRVLTEEEKLEDEKQSAIEQQNQAQKQQQIATEKRKKVFK